MKKLKITVATALFALLFSSNVHAQLPMQDAPNKKAEMAAQFKQDREKLGLNPEQETKFKEISMRYGQKMKALKSAEGDKKSKFGQFKELRDAKNTEVKALLNADQFNTYMKIQDERKAMRKENRQEK